MVHFRRVKIPGGSYFFTVTLNNRHSSLLTDHIHVLKNAMYKVNKALPYKTDAIVILPEHLHAIWTLPVDDSQYDLRWRRIKTLFTQQLKLAETALKKNQRGEYNLW